MQFRPTGGSGGGERIETPYDPEARWSEKRSDGWVGYKLHVTETEDAELPHLMTDSAVTPSTQYDGTALPAIRKRQQQRGVLPRERYADCGYISGTLIADGRPLGEELIGPMRTTSTPQSRLADGLTHADFLIDFERGHVFRREHFFIDIDLIGIPAIDLRTYVSIEPQISLDNESLDKFDISSIKRNNSQ